MNVPSPLSTDVPIGLPFSSTMLAPAGTPVITSSVTTSEPSSSLNCGLIRRRIGVSSKPIFSPVASVTDKVAPSTTASTSTVNVVVSTACATATSMPVAASVEITSSVPLKLLVAGVGKFPGRLTCKDARIALRSAVVSAVTVNTLLAAEILPFPGKVPSVEVTSDPSGKPDMRADKVSEPSLSAESTADRLSAIGVSSKPETSLAVAVGASATARTRIKWLVGPAEAVVLSESCVLTAVTSKVIFASLWVSSVSSKLSMAA